MHLIKKAKKVHKKISAKIIKMCRKLKIKCTKKVGKRRVYKSLAVLKKLIKKKLSRKKRKTTRKVRHKYKQRRSRFGNASDFSNSGPGNYGYNQPPNQYQGTLSQSSQIVTPATNEFRPSGLGLSDEYNTIYGVGRPFFTETVPTQVGPNWNFMGQPDGSLYAVGSPFVGYKKHAFGESYYDRVKKSKNYAKSKRYYDKAKKMSKKVAGGLYRVLEETGRTGIDTLNAVGGSLMFGKRRSRTVCRNCGYL